MTSDMHDKELDALKADIASLREAVAALAVGLKSPSGTSTGEAHAEGAHDARHVGPDQGDESHGIWTDLLHGLGVSRIHGEKVIRGLASEVERYPLVSIIAAFGLGFVVASLWYRGSRQ
ncbi:MAG: hypothetical protein NT072_07715 [Deltaproteobacteria bacterium]|nr:hypothetical protein [Deltaproteobacteria bacterium]